VKPSCCESSVSILKKPNEVRPFLKETTSCWIFSYASFFYLMI
jgi:hypothetical protein